jgi:hypothetical protein
MEVNLLASFSNVFRQHQVIYYRHTTFFSILIRCKVKIWMMLTLFPLDLQYCPNILNVIRGTLKILNVSKILRNMLICIIYLERGETANGKFRRDLSLCSSYSQQGY